MKKIQYFEAGGKIRQAFRPVACEILTDVLQILVPRLFVPLNLRVTLVTLYQGPPTPGDSILAAVLRQSCGSLAAVLRQSCCGLHVARPPAGDFLVLVAGFFSFIIPARFFGRFDIRFGRNLGPKLSSSRVQNGA